MNQLQLFTCLHTPTDVATFTQGLAAVQVGLYHPDTSFAKEVATALAVDLAKAVLAEASHRNINLEDLKACRGFCQDLQNEVKKLPVVELAVAFPVKSDFVRRLATWFTEQVGPTPLILKVTTKPDILGGVAVLQNGRYHDFTVAVGLKKMISEGRLSIGAVIAGG